MLPSLRRVPPNGSGIKQNIGALQSREPRTLGIPLIPANQRAHLADRRVKRAKAQVARSEIKFFVIERIVGNVHLAVDSPQAPASINDSSRIVIHAGGALFENGSDHAHPGRARHLSYDLRRGAGNCFCQIKQSGIFALAEVLRAEQLRQARDLRALPRCLPYHLQRMRHILLRIWPAAHLNQADAKFFRRHGISESLAYQSIHCS